ncbi:MFS transporter [Streptomyces sp. NPDC059578]|uniref:MFS transporter n=2 Tax=unclassified Streptomyces TaxID=2593676 RepID=UPI0036A3DD28
MVRHRTLRRLLPGFALSSLGDGMAVVAVSWFALQLAPEADRGIWVAAAAAAYTLPGAVGALVLGRVLGHRSPTQLAGWDAIVRACALGAIPIAYALGALNTWLYVVLLAASSVLHSWGQAGVYTLLARVLPQQDHLAGNAVLSTIGSFCTVVGPMIAAPLIVWGGAATVIAADAATFAVLAATFLFFIPAKSLPPLPQESDDTSRSSGLTVIRRDTALLGLLVLSFGFFFFFGPVYVALPLHVSEEMRGSAALLAAFYTSFGIGALIGGMLTGYLSRWRLWPTTTGIVIAFGAAMLPIGFDVPNIVALASFAAAGVLWPPYSSLATTLFQRSTPPALLPQVLAANSSVRVLSVPLGTALGGPLVAGFGGGATLRFAAIGILLLGLVSAVGLAYRASAARRTT